MLSKTSPYRQSIKEDSGDLRSDNNSVLLDRWSRRLTTILDDAFRIPGTNIRFGWDSVIGLIPGVGDATTTLLALVPVGTAWKLGAGRWLLTKMLCNVLIDATIGAVPIAGDAFDLFFRANRRNTKLLKKYQEQNTLRNLNKVNSKS